jgi:hypothetical protein
MKLLKISAVAVVLLGAAFFGLRAYNMSHAPESIQISARSAESIEAYLQSSMHDPGSLSIEFSTAALRLDTIQDAGLFAYKRPYHLVHVRHRGKNPLGATVVGESVFYVTKEGSCVSGAGLSELTTAEQSWITSATLKAAGL